MPGFDSRGQRTARGGDQLLFEQALHAHRRKLLRRLAHLALQCVVVDRPLLAHPPTRIQVLVDSADHQVLDVQSPGGVLITSELFYPGWRVRVDGVEASPLQVDLALRGVQLGAGRHRVEWDYRPTWLKQAIAATAVGILLLLALPLGLRGPSACDRPTAARATRGFDKRAPEVQ